MIRVWAGVGRAVALALVGLALFSVPATARELSLGFIDSDFMSSNPSDRAAGLTAATVAGRAQVVRLDSSWRTVAPSRPVTPGEPTDPAYSWTSLDVAVRAASERGLTVLLSYSGAPNWAEGAGRRASAQPGTWRPDAVAYRVFAEVLARRFSGAYTPPGATTPLPPVRYWQGWNEPNLDFYLAPQWVRSGSGFRAESPRVYRRLQNAFYAGVKAAGPANVVLGAGTAPYGDPLPGGKRIMPVRFLREALCLTAQNRAKACSDPIHLDALDHHPYAIRGPTSPSLNVDDAAVPDVEKLTRVMRSALNQGRLFPRERKEVWVTEFSWDSSPPDPRGVPLARQARWVVESFEVLWRQGVSTILWFRVRDQAPEPSYAATYQSGIVFRNGSQKPSARAFRFPLVVRAGRRRVRMWTRAPATGVLRVEVVSDGRTSTVYQRRVNDGDVISRTLGRRSGRWTAVMNADRSPSWSLR